MTTLNLATFAVRDESDVLDIEATVEKFRGTLLEYQVERETELATIGAAVHSVFDTYKGACINMPALTSFALQRLNVQPETHKALSERIQAFIHANSGDNGTTFRIAKGKGGGCCRVCDVPEKSEKK